MWQAKKQHSMLARDLRLTTMLKHACWLKYLSMSIADYRGSNIERIGHHNPSEHHLATRRKKVQFAPALSTLSVD